MIELFRRNLFINLLLIIPYILIIRIVTLINTSENFYDYSGSGIVLGNIYKLLSEPIVQSIAAVILIFAQVVLINNISIKNRLATEITLIAGIAYILLVSLSSPLLKFSPLYLANLFLLLAISSAFNTYKNTNAVGNIFATGFFVSVASIFHPPLIIFILWGFIALMILHSFKWKEKLQYISGVLVAIYLLYGFIYFFTEGFRKTIANFYNQLGMFQFKTINLEEWISLGIYGLIFIIVFFSFNYYGQKKRVEVQKKIDILFWYLAFCIPTIIFSELIEINNLLIIAPALSILIGINMSQTKQTLILELVHIVIIGTIVYTHFFLS